MLILLYLIIFSETQVLVNQTAMLEEIQKQTGLLENILSVLKQGQDIVEVNRYNSGVKCLYNIL